MSFKLKYTFKILNKKKFILCYINAFIVNLCIYLVPFVLAIYTKQPFSLENFKRLIFYIVIFKTIDIILNHIWIIYVLKFEEKYSKDLQLAYFNRATRIKPYKLNDIHNGFLKKQIDIISDEAKLFLEYIFETVNGFTISTTIFFIEVFTQSLKMFYICLFLIIVMVIYNLWLGKKYVKVQENYNESNSKFNSTYVDFLQNIKTVKRLNATKFAISKNEEAFDNVLPKLDKKNFYISLRSNGINFFIYFMYIIILIDLYIKMKSGEEVLSYLVFYAGIFSGLNTELKDLCRVFMHFNKLQAATNQVEKLIGNDEQNDILYNWNNIQIKDLEFKYNEESKTSINIPDFYITRGDKVSIVGKSGQGKTTFLNIFSRYIEVDENSYLIDGKSMKCSLNLAYISQEIDLFDLSIRDNLCLGEDISDEVLMKYLKEAGLGEWINKLENGLDTIVGERGLKVSVGQKQRLNIIRGILQNKDIYVLDEPTSNLDSETEKQIIYLIKKYLKDKTVVIVTHRDEIRKICNLHYEFKDSIMSKCNIEEIV